MRKVLLSLAAAFAVVAFVISIYEFFYIKSPELSEERMNYCTASNNDEECYKDVFYTLLPDLLIYKYKYKDKNINEKLIRLDASNRIFSYTAAKKADVLLSYGIWTDIHFENMFSKYLNKHAYAFDCSTNYSDIEVAIRNNPNCHFSPECIGTDKFVLASQTSNGRIHNLGEKIKELGLENKKIYLKMDIAGAEMEVMPDILNYSNQITGMSITFHPDTIEELLKMRSILKQINKDFVLTGRNTISNSNTEKIDLNSLLYKGFLLERSIILSYVNKDLLKNYSISLNQNTDKLYKNSYYFKYNQNQHLEKINTYEFRSIYPSDINIFFTLNEKIKNEIWKTHSKE